MIKYPRAKHPAMTSDIVLAGFCLYGGVTVSKICSVIAMLDEQAAQAFHRLRAYLPISEGIYNNTLPHITLCVYKETMEDIDGLIRWTQQVASRYPPLAVRYMSVGVFLQNCLIAMPAYTQRLYSLYYDLHQRYDDACKDYSALYNQEWTPHTGIWYTDMDQAAEHIGTLARVFRPIDARIAALRVTVLEDGAFRPLAEFRLMDER